MGKEISTKIDISLMKIFRQYLYNIFTRDDEHVKFMSGNLIGVNTPYFYATDENFFWDSVMLVDKVELSREFFYPHTPVRKEWNISGDLMNQTMAYLIHLILVSNLSEKDKEVFVKDILILFQYKFLTSKIFRDYKLGANLATATAAYDALPGHFLIKQVGSWMEYFKLRADRMWLGEGKHKDMRGILKSYNDDKDIINVIAGIANNMNTMMKAYNAIFYSLHESGVNISLSSAIEIDSEGVEKVGDKISGYGRYYRIVDSRIGQRDEFYNEELLEIITNQTTARFSKVKSLTDYISRNYGDKRHKEIHDFIYNANVFAFTELFNSGAELRDINSVVKLLLGKLSARRVGNEEFDNLVKFGSKVLRNSIGDNSQNIIVRNVFIVYMVVWTLITDKG